MSNTEDHTSNTDGQDSDISFQPRTLPKTDAEVDEFNRHELLDMKSRQYKPREVHIQVSKRCNLQCVMCSWATWQSNVGFMDMALFEKILDDCETSNVRKLVFANAQGEPFLNPHIFEMIEMAVNRGFWTMVSTNGTPFTPDRCARLARSGINNIQFSFAGYDKLTYETVYAGGQWEKVTKNLECLAAHLLSNAHQTTLVVNGCYAKELIDIVEPNAFVARTKSFLRSIGVWEPRAQVHIQLPHNFGGNITMGETSTDQDGHSNFAKPTKRPGLCRVLKNAPGIYHDGRVTACGCLDPNGDLLIGDIASQSITEIRQGDAFTKLLDDFTTDNFDTIPLCNGCDLPFYDAPEESPVLWPNLIDTKIVFHNKPKLQIRHEAQLLDILTNLLQETLDDGAKDYAQEASTLLSDIYTSAALRNSAIDTWELLFQADEGPALIKDPSGRTAKSVALAPATNVILENLDWFRKHFASVRVGDNIKKGQRHDSITIESMEDLVADSEGTDCFLMTTDTPEIQELFASILPKAKTTHIYDLRGPLSGCHLPEGGYERVKLLLREIENAKNPLVVLGNKLLPTSEPIFSALELTGHDIFVVSQFDKMERMGANETCYDDTALIFRNTILSFAEILYVLTHLQKGKFWIYYDFFYNVGWDAGNAVTAYAFNTAILEMASRPVVLGMYDVIKPVCTNMEKQTAASRLYKSMIEKADALVLTSKSDHVAEYLRNTLAKGKPVKSFYRYSLPPEKPKPRLSDLDGERHIVGVTSFLGEVYEPNRIETRNSIRSMLQQKIHFHYYSGNEKVFAFYESLPKNEQAYFHIEEPIWDQSELVYHMSQFDGGWLVGDEATIFADMIRQIDDRNIRELYTLFVPNGVPTSSMAYGAAGLPVFVSRQIKVMSEVFPAEGCIPLDMGEVDNLANIFARLDWKTIHKTMRKERHRFDVYRQIDNLAEFLHTI